MTIHQTLVFLPLVRGTKRPMLVRWSDPVLDPDTVAQVFAENPGCGVGIRLDGLVVIDCDSPERVSWWEGLNFLTAYVSRGRPERRSFWYRLPEDVELRPSRHAGWEIRTGPGQFCAVPPSVHPDTGRPYEWLGPAVTEKSPLPVAPVEFLTTLQGEDVERAPVGDGAGWDVVMEGEGRDNFLAAAAGFLRARGASVAAVRAGLKALNDTFCEPRMSSRDLDRISASSGRWIAETSYSFEESDGSAVHPRPSRPPSSGHRYSLVVPIPGDEGPPGPGGG